MSITLDGSNLTTAGVINSATAQASTSGTSIDFTGIPSGTKRITVMFNGVSTSGTSYVILQIGAGSVDATGYTGSTGEIQGSGAGSNLWSTGALIRVGPVGTNIRSGTITFNLFGSNIWAISASVGLEDSSDACFGGGRKTLSGTLDRVRITTVNGTDTFDAGSINILYE
jgi:hypothetical protein